MNPTRTFRTRQFQVTSTRKLSSRLDWADADLLFIFVKSSMTGATVELYMHTLAQAADSVSLHAMALCIPRLPEH
jgi:hypothetical protein